MLVYLIHKSKLSKYPLVGLLSLELWCVHYVLWVLGWSMRGKFDSELVSVSHWFSGRMSVRKTVDLRFKSQLRHKLFSQYLSSKGNIVIVKKFDLDIWSENLFRRTMHSFFWELNKADPSRLWMKREISGNPKEISGSLVSSS